MSLVLPRNLHMGHFLYSIRHAMSYLRSSSSPYFYFCFSCPLLQRRITNCFSSLFDESLCFGQIASCCFHQGNNSSLKFYIVRLSLFVSLSHTPLALRKGGRLLSVTDPRLKMNILFWTLPRSSRSRGRAGELCGYPSLLNP